MCCKRLPPLFEQACCLGIPTLNTLEALNLYPTRHSHDYTKNNDTTGHKWRLKVQGKEESIKIHPCTQSNSEAPWCCWHADHGAYSVRLEASHLDSVLTIIL